MNNTVAGANVSLPNSTPLLYGEKATYSCPSGCTSKGGTFFNIDCQNDGNFSSFPTDFLCEVGM